MADEPTPTETPLLDALLAALSEMEDAERVRFLRAYLEYGLDLLEANELEHFRFLGECALLAVENMQDVRLENLELRVKGLEQPPTKAWGEVLTDVMLGLAVEVAALVLLEAAAAAVISMAGYRAMLVAKSAAEAELVVARSESTAIGKLLTETVAKQDEAQRVVGDLESMARRGGYRTSPAKKGGWLVQPYDWGPEFHVPQEALRGAAVNPEPFIAEYQLQSLRVALGQTATVDSRNRVEQALKMLERAQLDGRSRDAAIEAAWGSAWKDFLGAERGGVLLSLTSSVITGASEARTGQDAPSGPDRPFLTSEVAARYLDWAGVERMAVAQRYANMRFLLRATSDEDIVAGDIYVRYLAYLQTEVTAKWEGVRQKAQAGRSNFVEAYEACFWREYLSANGMLAQDPVGEYSSREKGLPAGTIVGGHLLTGELEDNWAIHYKTNVPGNTRYRSFHLPGAMRLDERLAGVLYQRFARPYFADTGHAATLKPFEYEAEAYENVAIPPEEGFWGQPDPEAVRRINEMRHMVIQFFIGVEELSSKDQLDLGETGLDFLGAVAGDEADRSLTAWLDSMAQGVDKSGHDAGLAEVLSTHSAEAAFVALAGTPQQPGDLTVQATFVQHDLAIKLTDLNLDVQTYQFLATGALEPTDLGGRTKETLLEEIEREKDALTLAWDTLRGLVGEGQEELILPYQAAYEAIVGWQPGSAWVWYGPDAQPEAP